MTVIIDYDYEVPDHEGYAVVVPRRVPIAARAERLPEHGFILDEQTFKPMLPSSCGCFFNNLWNPDGSWVGFVWNDPDLSPTLENNDYLLMTMLADRSYFGKNSFGFVKLSLDVQTPFEDVRESDEEMFLKIMTFQGDRGDQAFAIELCWVEPDRLSLLSRVVTLLGETTTF